MCPYFPIPPMYIYEVLDYFLRLFVDLRVEGESLFCFWIFFSLLREYFVLFLVIPGVQRIDDLLLGTRLLRHSFNLVIDSWFECEFFAFIFLFLFFLLESCIIYFLLLYPYEFILSQMNRRPLSFIYFSLHDLFRFLIHSYWLTTFQFFSLFLFLTDLSLHLPIVHYFMMLICLIHIHSISLLLLIFILSVCLIYVILNHLLTCPVLTHTILLNFLKLFVRIDLCLYICEILIFILVLYNYHTNLP